VRQVDFTAKAKSKRGGRISLREQKVGVAGGFHRESRGGVAGGFHRRDRSECGR
jgi:hypothetical protein